jgi:hypothetical protein
MNPGHTDHATRLDDALGSLPRSIEPGRDLWPAIDARLEPRTGHAARRWHWPAAAAVLLVVGSSFLTAQLLRREEPAVARQAPASDALTFTAAAFGPGHSLDPAYDAARQDLARTLSARIDRLPPEARQQLEKNLAELRRASDEINAALELSPGDPLLEELLLNAYQDELAVLASVNQLAGGNGAGTTTDPTRMRL